VPVRTAIGIGTELPFTSGVEAGAFPHRGTSLAGSRPRNRPTTRCPAERVARDSGLLVPHLTQ
jgi:hypothetical protein